MTRTWNIEDVKNMAKTITTPNLVTMNAATLVEVKLTLGNYTAAVNVNHDLTLSTVTGTATMYGIADFIDVYPILIKNIPSTTFTTTPKVIATSPSNIKVYRVILYDKETMRTLQINLTAHHGTTLQNITMRISDNPSR